LVNPDHPVACIPPEAVGLQGVALNPVLAEVSPDLVDMLPYVVVAVQRTTLRAAPPKQVHYLPVLYQRIGAEGLEIVSQSCRLAHTGVTLLRMRIESLRLSCLPYRVNGRGAVRLV
jgi:hypothetical protein